MMDELFVCGTCCPEFQAQEKCDRGHKTPCMRVDENNELPALRAENARLEQRVAELGNDYRRASRFVDKLRLERIAWQEREKAMQSVVEAARKYCIAMEDDRVGGVEASDFYYALFYEIDALDKLENDDTQR
jgi:hypothetical protein